MTLLPATNDAGHFEVPDFDGTSGFRLHIPETAFAIQMTRHYLMEQVRAWTTVERGGYTASVSSYLGDGSFRLTLLAPDDPAQPSEPFSPVDVDLGDPGAILASMPMTFAGIVYLTERLFPASEFFRIQGWWALPPQAWQVSSHVQSNYIEYPPLVKWDDPVFERRR